jgi:hypothetical protein
VKDFPGKAVLYWDVGWNEEGSERAAEVILDFCEKNGYPPLSSLGWGAFIAGTSEHSGDQAYQKTTEFDH